MRAVAFVQLLSESHCVLAHLKLNALQRQWLQVGCESLRFPGQAVRLWQWPQIRVSMPLQVQHIGATLALSAVLVRT